jgi:hypothetical protein
MHPDLAIADTRVTNRGNEDLTESTIMDESDNRGVIQPIQGVRKRIQSRVARSKQA